MQHTQPSSQESPPRTGEVFADKAHVGIDRLSTGAHDTVERVAAATANAAERLGAKGGEWLQAKDQWAESTRGYVREHPLAALGIALAAGYLLSRLTSR
jgi:ElaB/YqjD/DUF883 family membrane-anchored ribosome-binding protein